MLRSRPGAVCPWNDRWRGWFWGGPRCDRRATGWRDYWQGTGGCGGTLLRCGTAVRCGGGASLAELASAAKPRHRWASGLLFDLWLVPRAGSCHDCEFMECLFDPHWIDGPRGCHQGGCRDGCIWYWAGSAHAPLGPAQPSGQAAGRNGKRTSTTIAPRRWAHRCARMDGIGCRLRNARHGARLVVTHQRLALDREGSCVEFLGRAERGCQRLRDTLRNQFSDPSFPVRSTPCCAPSSSSTALTGSGGLIQTSSGSFAARGGPAPKRSGWAA